MHRNTLPTVDGALFAELANWQHLSMQLRRKSRRETQRRYRKKQADHMVSLEKDVQQLQDEITKLQQRRVSTETASKVRRDIWNVALEYYATFRRVSTQDVGSHLKFLRETMAPDVASIDGFGPVNLAKSWSVWRWFDDVDVDLQALEKHGENAVVLTTRTSLKITERTLKNLVPHLYGDGEKNWVKASVVAKLVDQRIVVDGLTIFQWDCTANVMASVKARNDLVTPVFRLLGSLKEVSLVFDQALVSPDLHRRSIP
ncbi:hypothetical protein GN244_ATG18830 [Phytophthora infestans]|uniref:Bzip transcription factor n=1 Tax=Phytophthora infestans TaxID=4787 RepID=A0A833W5L4_PHYIN|nr:hypothetical protein GN244_ATG18830 [Phytophthora infestans]KAF4138579.1 hypothetical protein GN958_ATG12227 [Phytophthora infestans]